MVCKRSCGVFNSPLRIARCNITLLSDNMTDPDAMRRYVTFPQVPDAMRNTLWQWDPVSGTVASWGPDACLRLPLTILGISPYNWNLYIPIGQPQQVTVNVLLMTPTVAAGVVLRLQSATINYYASVSIATGVSLFRVYGATPRLLGSWYNASVLGGIVPGVDWLTISAFHAGTQLQVHTIMFL